MKNRVKFTIPSKLILFLLTIFCIVCIIMSYINSNFGKPVKDAVATVIVPMQEGINSIGTWFSDKTSLMAYKKDLIAENESLKARVDELTEENTQLAQSKYELDNLRDLYNLDTEYSQYDKVAARVIARDTGNWFNTFTINKGSNDGLKTDMNVISNGGLVGIVTEVGSTYAKVRSIIDDDSSVSVKFTSTSDSAIVSGDLELIEDGYILVSDISIDADVSEGDMVLTSDISSKFLPGILVGYVTNLSEDANNLTKSGYVIPAVDFEHISNVLVITELKETGEE
ncbi:MAG: rod shape-determining protein MreC [Eubacterium sp.]